MITCTRWQPYEKNTLRGFADLYMDKVGMTIRDCTYHEKNGKSWVAFPSAPMIKSGGLVKDEEGKTVYTKPFISFDEKTSERFREAAVMAIRAKIGELAAA